MNKELIIHTPNISMGNNNFTNINTTINKMSYNIGSHTPSAASSSINIPITNCISTNS